MVTTKYCMSRDIKHFTFNRLTSTHVNGHGQSSVKKQWRACNEIYSMFTVGWGLAMKALSGLVPSTRIS